MRCLGRDVSYLHVVGDSWLLCETKDGDGVQCEVAGGRGYAGVAEEEETVTAERNEIDWRVCWQAECYRTGAGKGYSTGVCEESGHAGR